MKKAIRIFLAMLCCIKSFTVFASDKSIESSNSYFYLFISEYNKQANKILVDMVDIMSKGMNADDNGYRNDKPVYVTLADGIKFTMVPSGGKLSIGLTPTIRKSLVTSDFKSAYFYQYSGNEGKFEIKYKPGSTNVFKELGIENSPSRTSGSSSQTHNPSKPARTTAPSAPKANLPENFSSDGYAVSPIGLSIAPVRGTNKKCVSINANVTTLSNGFTYIYYFLDQKGNRVFVPKELKCPPNVNSITYLDGKRTIGQQIRGAYRANKDAVSGMATYVDDFKLCNPVPTGVYCVVELYDDSNVLKARRVSSYLRLF